MTDKPMTQVQQHLSIPENRIKYVYTFFGRDDFDQRKCYDSLSQWIDKVDSSESHY